MVSKYEHFYSYGNHMLIFYYVVKWCVFVWRWIWGRL